jgi:hypothetical protein
MRDLSHPASDPNTALQPGDSKRSGSGSNLAKENARQLVELVAFGVFVTAVATALFFWGT